MTLPLLVYFLSALISGGITAGLALGVFAVYHNPLSERFLKFFGLLAAYLVLMPIGYIAFGPDYQSADVQIIVHVFYFAIYSLWTPVIADIFYEFRQNPNKGWGKTVSWTIAGLGLITGLVLLVLPLQPEDKIQWQRWLLNGGILPLFLAYV